MDRQLFMENVSRIISSSEFNTIPKEKALSDELISVKIFDEPIIGISNADNAAFQKLQSEDVIGKHFMLPADWLPEARTVISFFFPFTEIIRSSNRENMRYPSKGWLHGRIEGQYFLNDFSACMVNFLTGNGYTSVAPSIDKRFFTNSDNDNHGIKTLYTSNWSERHVAYVCGLGTFGLSKGLITEKGVAGRFASVVTQLDLMPDDTSYKRYDENCIMCGKCIKNCPANAISMTHGKSHKMCSAFINEVLAENAPWYGCGKCQTGVPCEYKNPHQQK